MATGKNHQHGKYNGALPSPLLSPEYTEELHVKMCKKIAQLTKVIYALNVKVDEYETNILTIKETHQNEIEQLSSETKEKVLQYETLLGEDKNLRLQIQNLKEALDKNNIVKEKALADLAMHKKQTEEQELRSQYEQAERMAALSREMVSMKTDFENRIQQLTDETDALRREQTLGDKETSVEKLNEKLNKEIQALSKEVESLKILNHKLSEEYSMKTNKFQSNYMKEKEHLRKSLQQSVTEMIKQLQQKEQDHRKASQVKEAAMQLEVKQLKGDIKAKELEILEAKELSSKMQEQVQDLEQQLNQRDKKLLECRSVQSQLEEELAVARERLLQQENEIQSQIEQLKAMSSEHKAALAELAELKSQLDQLQQRPSRKTCAGRRDSGEAIHSKQAYREHSLTRQDHTKQHKEELSKTKRQREAETKHLAKSREDLTKIHSAEIKSMRMSLGAEKRQLQKEHEILMEDLKRKNEAEKKQLRDERDALYLKLQNSICKDVSSQHLTKQNLQLADYEKEISRLERENLVLQDTVEMLNREMSKAQQDAMELQDKQTRNENDLKLKQGMELESLKESHQQEIQAIVSKFSSAQAFLQANIVTLEAELKEMEERAKQQPRPEDLHFINSLQDKLTDKDQIIKHLLEIQNFDDDITMPLIQETHRSQSFSCNPNSGSLTPTMKKKKLGEMPTRVISVPNLAAYENTFTNNNVCPKKPVSPVRTSPSSDHRIKAGYPFRQPAQLLDIIRPNRRNPNSVSTKMEAKEPECKRPEWFTKYFSF
ncbi:protein FAM184B [Gastrophryne carolinensis]